MLAKVWAYGRQRTVPGASERGRWEGAMRLRVLRSALADAIEACPPAERRLVSMLQDAWLFLDSRLDLDVDSGGEWPNLF